MPQNTGILERPELQEAREASQGGINTKVPTVPDPGKPGRLAEKRDIWLSSGSWRGDCQKEVIPGVRVLDVTRR